jgi:hypothetical protein
VLENLGCKFIKKIKNPKNQCFHSLMAHQIGGDMCNKNKIPHIVHFTFGSFVGVFVAAWMT